MTSELPNPPRTVWAPVGAPATIRIIDQRQLPWRLVTEDLRRVADVATAIRDMWVRGAPLIGVTAAYGLAIALASDTSDAHLQSSAALLRATRPTAVNLHWALARMEARLNTCAPSQRLEAAWQEAAAIEASQAATLAQEQAAAEAAAARASALSKLAKLGLTANEISALVGA